MLSTEKAAEILGITKRRVQELVKDGTLKAEKVSGIWLVDEGSVRARLESGPGRSGRPRRGKGRNEVEFMLMNRGHEIAPLIYNVSSKSFTFVGEVLDIRRAPIGLADSRGKIDKVAFGEWWRGRGIPLTRSGLAKLLEAAGVEMPEELVQRNLGLSLSDQYWIRPEGSGLRWEDVNFFNNDFDAVSLATKPYSRKGVQAKAKPDNTSDGNLEKSWVCLDGVRTLLKGGTTYGQEPYNEVVATALHKRLLPEEAFVHYSLVGEGASAQSACADFLTDEEEYVPALYVERALPESPHLDDYEHYIACCEHCGARGTREALDRMIVCDDIIANHDRHRRNFGIIRNVETLECRPAPIFDSGSSLWCDVPTDEMRRGEHSFTSRQFYASPAKQMLLVGDRSWFDIAALEGFVDEACEILARNDALVARLSFVRSALEWRVERMINIVEWN